jgi:hypothetical protein
MNLSVSRRLVSAKPSAISSSLTDRADHSILECCTSLCPPALTNVPLAEINLWKYKNENTTLKLLDGQFEITQKPIRLGRIKNQAS